MTDYPEDPLVYKIMADNLERKLGRRRIAVSFIWTDKRLQSADK